MPAAAFGSTQARGRLRRVNAWLRRHCGPSYRWVSRARLRPGPPLPSMPSCELALARSRGCRAGRLRRPRTHAPGAPSERREPPGSRTSGSSSWPPRPGRQPPSRDSTTGLRTDRARRLRRRSSRPVPVYLEAGALPARDDGGTLAGVAEAVERHRRAGRPGPRPVLRRPSAQVELLSERTGSLAMPFAHLTCAAAGARCSCGASSIAPVCSSTATSPRRRRRGAPTTGSGPTRRAYPGWEVGRGRREGPARRLSRRVRDDRRGRAARAARKPRAPGARPRGQARREGLLAPVRALPGLRRHVRARRDATSASRGKRTTGSSSSASARGVHIASPTTLIALLQAIAYGWQQEKVAEDARKVHELGRRLYESLSVMGGHLAKVGSSLDKAVRRIQPGGGVDRAAGSPTGTQAGRARGLRQADRGARADHEPCCPAPGTGAGPADARDAPAGRQRRLIRGTAGGPRSVSTVKGNTRPEEHWDDRD